MYYMISLQAAVMIQQYATICSLLSGQISTFCTLQENLNVGSKNDFHLLEWARRPLPPCKLCGGDQTTRVDWRCENVVFVCFLFFFSGRIAVKRKTARTIFTQRPKISIFCPAWAIRCTDSCEIWHGRAARGSTWPCKISHQSVHGVGTRPQKLKISTFGKDSTQCQTL